MPASHEACGAPSAERLTSARRPAPPQAYGRELTEAYEWLSKYRASRKEAELHQVGGARAGRELRMTLPCHGLGLSWPEARHVAPRPLELSLITSHTHVLTLHTPTHTQTHTHYVQAWDLYYHVFKRINKQLHQLTTLELQYVAPALVRAQVRTRGSRAQASQLLRLQGSHPSRTAPASQPARVKGLQGMQLGLAPDPLGTPDGVAVYLPSPQPQTLRRAWSWRCRAPTSRASRWSPSLPSRRSCRCGQGYTAVGPQPFAWVKLVRPRGCVITTLKHSQVAHAIV